MRNICPFCNRRPLNDLRGVSEYWYCNSCSIAKLKKIPKVNYNEAYYEGKSSFISKLFSPIANFFYAKRRAYVGNILYNFWIDVGAGEGGFLKTVPALRKLGVEVSVAGRKKMKKSRLKAITEKEFLCSKNLKADVISFWHVLEHVENPWDYLAVAKRNLNKAARIIIGVPNQDSFESLFFGRHWFHLVPNYHIWHFSPKSITMLLKKTGFKVGKIDYWSVEHHLAGVLQSFINKTANSDSVLHRLIRRKDKFSSITFKDIFWSSFWLTIGLPIVLLFWIAGSIFRKPGTIVVVAYVE